MWEKKLINRFVVVNLVKVICRIVKLLILKKKVNKWFFLRDWYIGFVFSES